MNRTNYHSHCTYCDGKSPIEDFVEQAVNDGFTSYGISSHCPLPFHAPWVMDARDVDKYIKEINALKIKYEGTVDIYSGMEIDYLDDGYGPSVPYFRNMPLDYRIGSVHFISPVKGVYMDIDAGGEQFVSELKKFYAGDLKKAAAEYFDASARMVKLGGFDFIAHCDKIATNADYAAAGTSGEKWFTDMVKDYLAFIAEKGVMAEINTKRYGVLGTFFPDRKYFKFMKELGIPVLVNSDSHRVNLINDHRETALGMLKEAGFETVREMSDGKWIDVPVR